VGFGQEVSAAGEGFDVEKLVFDEPMDRFDIALSSGSLPARRSNSACFHPSSWITTSTIPGDTMWGGFPILVLVRFLLTFQAGAAKSLKGIVGTVRCG